MVLQYHVDIFAGGIDGGFHSFFVFVSFVGFFSPCFELVDDVSLTGLRAVF